MDKNTIAVLQDYQTSIENSFAKIDKKLKSASKKDISKKRPAINSIKQEFANIKSNISLMKTELENLTTDSNITSWQETISQLKKQFNSYKSKLTEIENAAKNYEGNPDHLDVDANVDLNKLNAQQVMDRGDKILDADDQAIDNMGKIVGQDVEIMKGVNVELYNQNEQLDNIDDDLSEIDYSLKRAKKQITTMFKMYATDKCIMCMIVAILLVIVTIIIVSALGGDPQNHFNVPHDIFNTNNSTTNETSDCFYYKIRYLNIGIFLINYIL